MNRNINWRKRVQARVEWAYDTDPMESLTSSAFRSKIHFLYFLGRCTSNIRVKQILADPRWVNIWCAVITFARPHLKHCLTWPSMHAVHQNCLCDSEWSQYFYATVKQLLSMWPCSHLKQAASKGYGIAYRWFCTSMGTRKLHFTLHEKSF